MRTLEDVSFTAEPKSDQLNADDFVSGPGIFSIEKVEFNNSEQQPLNVYLSGIERPYRPCKIMRRAMIELWGSNALAWPGRQIQLYRDPAAEYGGKAVGGIRICGLSDIKASAKLTVTVGRGRRGEFHIKKLEQQAEQATPVLVSDILNAAPECKTIQEANDLLVKAANFSPENKRKLFGLLNTAMEGIGKFNETMKLFVPTGEVLK